MQRMLVMTVIGQDRPGLVESVARLVAENGGNWLEILEGVKPGEQIVTAGAEALSEGSSVRVARPQK